MRKSFIDAQIKAAEKDRRREERRKAKEEAAVARGSPGDDTDVT